MSASLHGAHDLVYIYRLERSIALAHMHHGSLFRDGKSGIDIREVGLKLNAICCCGHRSAPLAPGNAKKTMGKNPLGGDDRPLHLRLPSEAPVILSVAGLRTSQALP